MKYTLKRMMIFLCAAAMLLTCMTGCSQSDRPTLPVNEEKQEEEKKAAEKKEEQETAAEKTAATEEQETETEPEPVTEPEPTFTTVISSGELIVNIYGVDYDLNNVTPGDFVANGFVFWKKSGGAEKFEHQNEWGYLTLAVDWSQVEGEYDRETRTAPDSYFVQPITSFHYEGSHLGEEGKTCTLPGGIVHWESTYEDVIAAYGEPDDKYEISYVSGPATGIVYEHFADGWVLDLSFEGIESGVVSEISLWQAD